MARSIYTEQEAQFLKNIGYRVQFFRKKAGLSQEELAERCGMSYSTIINFALSHVDCRTLQDRQCPRHLTISTSKI